MVLCVSRYGNLFSSRDYWIYWSTPQVQDSPSSRFVADLNFPSIKRFVIYSLSLKMYVVFWVSRLLDLYRVIWGSVLSELEDNICMETDEFVLYYSSWGFFLVVCILYAYLIAA